MVQRDRGMLWILLQDLSHVGTLAATADYAKQDGTELSAHEAVDDDVD